MNRVKRNDVISGLRPHKARRGQALILLAVMMTAVLGMAAVTVDFGTAYYSHSELLASTQAATLAGARAMAQPGATATSVIGATGSGGVVALYSAVAGNKNAYANMTGVSVAATLKCLTTLKSSFGVYCYGPATSAYPNGTNALVVTQTVSVPLTFAGMFGMRSITLSSTATASMKGASTSPYNVAVLVDTTQSMYSSTDSGTGSNCGNKRIYCALQGVQVLLQNLSPCLSSATSCGSATANSSGGGANVASSVDRVSLFAFPPVTTATAVDDYNCGRTVPTTVGYTTPFPATSTYRIVNFSSDYKTSDGAASLNATSNIVMSTSANGKAGQTNCLYAKGGFGTYYAQAIAAAQASLVAEQTAFPNSQNVLIVLSDGDAAASCSTKSGGVCTAGDMVGASTTAATGAYPPESTIDECGQAVSAAATAAAAGTRVYAVAYGSPSSGCATDSKYTPCTTMQNIASSAGYFFSDYVATGGSNSCVSASQPTTSLRQIFQVIAGDLTVAKLIPNGTT